MHSDDGVMFMALRDGSPNGECVFLYFIFILRLDFTKISKLTLMRKNWHRGRGLIEIGLPFTGLNNKLILIHKF